MADVQRGGMNADEELLVEARRAPIISQATINALEEQIEQTKPGALMCGTILPPPECLMGEQPEREPSEDQPAGGNGEPDRALSSPSSEASHDENSESEANVPNVPAHLSPSPKRFLSRRSKCEAYPPVEDQFQMAAHEDIQDAAAAAEAELIEIRSTLSNSSVDLPHRQICAHKLARELARKPPTFSAEQLEMHSPVPHLLGLLEEDNSSLTRQLILACLTNMASVSLKLIATECPAVPNFLLSALRDAEGDPALRTYALAMAFNLSRAENVMLSLARGGAVPIVRNLQLNFVGPGTKEAMYAADTLRGMKKHEQKRPSNAARVLSRVSSFSRSRRSIASSDRDENMVKNWRC
ncbi:MAG: hypothetical protein SGPRY_002614 [Prymnesium sp.]